MTVSWEWCNRI